jgi:CheY-like chemotaxis protein/anti-sigma regulatory factor (Ser/Thr protein kinase)
MAFQAKPRRALVVDDSRTQAFAIRQKLLRGGFQVDMAGNGLEALAALEQQLPSIVLTDLMMPEMDGLELVTQIRRLHPGLPVVLLTAHGSEEVAVRALRSGAASYVPKKNLDRDLYRTLENVLAHCRTAKSDDQSSACLTATQSEFVLGNEADWIGPLVGRLQRELLRLQLFDDSTQMRIGMAVREALANGVEHGNLEASSQLRESDDAAYQRLLAERRATEPYRTRRLHVAADQSRGGVTYRIRDEGPGFDRSVLPDPTDPANLEKVSGRGLMLIHAFMDEVSHNPSGNEITMVKRA